MSGFVRRARLAGPGRLPMVESYLSDVWEVYTTDTTERPEQFAFPLIAAVKRLTASVATDSSSACRLCV